MIIDMLQLEDNQYTFKGQKYLLTPEDDVWFQLSHVFIGDVNEVIDKKKAELAENPAYKHMQMTQSGQQVTDTKLMADAIKNMNK